MTQPSRKTRLPYSPTALALLPLIACAPTSSNSCGTLFIYDKQTEQQEVRELDAMKTASVYPVTRMMMDDYHTTRDTIRACGK